MDQTPDPGKPREDEINADNTHKNTRKPLPEDDSFKSTPRNHRLGWERPQDEQMYESFDDLRANREEGDK